MIGRMVGMIVVITCVLVPVAMANFVRMLHLDGQVGTSHVNERDGDDQQALEDDSHVNSQGSGNGLKHTPCMKGAT